MSEEMPLHVRVALALGWRWYRHSDGTRSLHPGERFLADPATVEGVSWIVPADGSEPLAMYRRADGLAVWESTVPRYDIDWYATGPLIQKYRIKLRPVSPSNDRVHWETRAFGRRVVESGPDPLEAVCHLILALSEAGKL